MELKHVIELAWKRRVTVLAVALLTLALSTVLALTKTAKYESTATIAMTPDTSAAQFLGADDLTALLGTYAATAESSITERRAAQILGGPIDADISTSTQAGTGVLKISARSTNPEQAARAAKATASAFQESVASNKLLRATLIDPPAADSTPVQPRAPLIVVVGTLLGLFGGLLLAFGLEQFRRRIETSADVARYTPAPVIGRIPRDRSLQRGRARVIWDDDHAVALQESYRALRTNLQFVLESEHAVLEITSPEPAQGKSTVVANLGVAFGQLGVPTVIVDADLRRPRQHQIFALDNSRGLSTAMALSDDPELVPSGYPGLWIVPSGPVPPDPTEMLHIRLGRVIEWLRDRDVLVLIDTPPVLPVSDARLIAPHTDGVLLVVTAGTQRPAGLESALERLNMVEAGPRGVILNTIPGDATDTVGGYYYQRDDVATLEPAPPPSVELR
jgi:capsular exopolysaccharide synthesis family protein